MKKKFSDIIRDTTHGTQSQKINLKKTKLVHIPLGKSARFFVVSFMISWFIFGSVNAPIDGASLFAASNKETQRAQLEAELKELEGQIAQYETTVNQYKQQGKTLEGEIQRLNDKIKKLNLQIRSITLNLQRLDRDIESTKDQITKTENDIGQYRQSLTMLLQNIYESEGRSVVEMIAANPKLSDFFLDLNNLLVLQDNIRITLEKVVDLKTELINQKEALALEYEDVEQLRIYQQEQARSITQTESEKKTLLKETKGQESKYQEILEEKKKTAAQIRSQIFELLGGGELSFGEAYRLAKIAQDATGVRAALILAVLDGESALGRNVGRCTYDKNPYYPTKASNQTTMHPTRDIPYFLEITQKLGLDAATTPVSCPIPQDGAYGGAMGPAQFIPSTWAIYESKIASLVNVPVPSPWNNMHAFIATALYLKDAGAANASLYEEKVAAAKYYAGGRWRYYLNSYGARAVNKAQEFQADIDVLDA